MNNNEVFTEAELQTFIEKGYIKLDNAFSQELAAQAREILWQDTGCDPYNPSTWVLSVIRLGEYGQEPFQKAVNTPRLHAAFDQLVGAGRWLPRMSLGSFPIRFPSPEDSGDTGWHVDASFPGEDVGDFFKWRINMNSRGRALLMLFLFSDVGEADAPTRIRVGSHLDVVRLLQPEGDMGLSFMELAAKLDTLPDRPVEMATGKAGTVYLCHPFLVHAAQLHRGTQPKFMAQPPLHPAEPFQLYQPDKLYSPVEQAIRLGVGLIDTTYISQ
jgi:hypothetical protein